MATPFLLFSPLSPSYAFTPSDNMISVKLDGGRSRLRRDQLAGDGLIEANWILDRGEYTTFMGFFRERIQDCSRDFRCNLVLDVNASVPYVCRCISRPKLTSQSGNAFYVSATLEVTPNPTRSFTLFLQNVATPQIVDAGTVDYIGDLTDFPTGRDVILTGTKDLVTGITINLDGQYTLNTAPNTFTRTLLNAAIINPGWTTLNATAPQAYFPTSGAAILVPL
jgi:hypothetical protein